MESKIDKELPYGWVMVSKDNDGSVFFERWKIIDREKRIQLYCCIAQNDDKIYKGYICFYVGRLCSYPFKSPKSKDLIRVINKLDGMVDKAKLIIKKCESDIEILRDELSIKIESLRDLRDNLLSKIKI